MEHIPVFLNECLELLNIKPNGIYLDLTVGRAGHSVEILKKIDKGFLYAFDLDLQAIKESESILHKVNNNFKMIHSNFKDFDIVLKNNNIGKVDGILLDLGVSSPQLDDAKRGFSYRFDGPLDMRMNTENKLTAKYIVNRYSLDELTNIFRIYGEEKDAYKIAKNIIKHRLEKEIETTLELVSIIKEAKSIKELNKKGHPAKQVFQAIRIATNDELNNLKETLNKALNYLNKDGRLVVISFHSLEDRIVKQVFKNAAVIVGNRIDDLKKNDVTPSFMLVNKKVILPTEEEINKNHRSKSAKLRAIKKI